MASSRSGGHPAASPATGLLRLRAVHVGGRTVLAEVERTVPFHPAPPSYRTGDGAAEVTVQQVGPGLFPDESLRAEVVVEAGARLVVRGQGATKVYPSPTGAVARCVTRLRVEAGGCLVWLPGELIPFRGAVLEQETEADLAAGARLAMAEILTPGRLAMGERDAYERLDLRLRVRVAGRLVLAERACLEPGRRPLAAVGRHGPFACAATLYTVGFGNTAPTPGQGASAAGAWCGSGGAEDVAVARLLGATAQDLRTQVLDLIRQADRDA